MPRFLRVLFLVPFLGGCVFGAGSGITFSLTGIDPLTGKIYNIQGGGEGGYFPDPFLAGPGKRSLFLQVFQLV
jgi:hypothetical protein